MISTLRQKNEQQKVDIKLLKRKIRLLEEMITDHKQTIKELRAENEALKLEQILGKKPTPKNGSRQTMWDPFRGPIEVEIIRPGDILEGTVVKQEECRSLSRRAQ